MSEKDSSLSSSNESAGERRFRRSHRAAQRRRAAERADSRFFRAVFSIAGVGAALAVGLAVFAMNGGGDVSGLTGLAEPWIGGFSRLEVFGIVFILCLGALFFWRVRKR